MFPYRNFSYVRTFLYYAKTLLPEDRRDLPCLIAPPYPYSYLFIRPWSGTFLKYEAVQKISNGTLLSSLLFHKIRSFIVPFKT